MANRRRPPAGYASARLRWPSRSPWSPHLKMIGSSSRRGWIQAIQLKLPLGLSAGASGIRTKSSTPSSLKACPTLPSANVAPPSIVPSLWPTGSVASPSAGHHATRSLGASAHVTGSVGATDAIAAVVAATVGTLAVVAGADTATVAPAAVGGGALGAIDPPPQPSNATAHTTTKRARPIPPIPRPSRARPPARSSRHLHAPDVGQRSRPKPT